MKYCPNCGTANDDTGVICIGCGTTLSNNRVAQPQANYAPTYQPVYQQVVPPVQHTYPIIPPEYQPVSIGEYILYSIGFSIPLVGLILLIIAATTSTKISLKNFAQSILLMYLIAFMLIIIPYLLIVLAAM